MSNVIEFPVIPRKPADRVIKEHVYRCIQCGHEERPGFADFALYCDRWIQTGRRTGQCGAEMRPVEK